MLIGKIESFVHLVVSGWCFDGGSGDDEIRLECNGRELSTEVARFERPDVAREYGLANPAVGFSLYVPPACWSFAENGACNLSVIVNGNRLPGHPVQLNQTGLLSELDRFSTGSGVTDFERRAFSSHLFNSGCMRQLSDDQRRNMELYLPSGESTIPGIIDFHIDQFKDLTLAGWVVSVDEPGKERFEVVCNGLQLSRCVIRTARPDIADALGITAVRTGFEIMLPGYIWEFAGPAGCVLNVYVNGNHITGEGIVLTQNDLIACLERLGRLPSGDRGQKPTIALLEHIRYSGLLDRLNEEQRTFADNFAREFGLSDFLYAGRAPMHVPIKKVDENNPYAKADAFAWRLQTTFNAGLQKNSREDPYALFLRMMGKKEIEAQCAWLVHILTPYFCRIDKFELLFQHLEPQIFSYEAERISADAANVYQMSVALPILVLSGMPQIALEACRKLEAGTNIGWMSTECVAYSLKCMLATYRRGGMEYRLLQEYSLSMLGIIESIGGGGYWTRLHDLDLIESVILLLQNIEHFDAEASSKIISSALTNYALCPTFWQRVRSSGLVSARVSPSFAEIDSKSQRFFELLESAQFRQAEGWWEAQEILMYFQSRANVDALAYMREISVHWLTGEHIRAEFMRRGSTLKAICDASPTDILRFASLPGLDSDACTFDPGAVKLAMEPLIAVRRHPKRTLISSIALQIEKFSMQDRSAVHAGASNELMEGVGQLCASDCDYMGFDFLISIYVGSDAKVFETLIGEVERVFFDSLDFAITSGAIPAPVLAGIARGIGFCEQRHDSVMEAFLDKAKVSIEKQWGGAYSHVWSRVAGAAVNANARSVFSDTLIVVYSCKKNLDTNVRAIRKTWLKDAQSRGLPYVILVGDGDGKLDGDVLSLEGSDHYEALPAKTLSLFKWFLHQTNYQYLYKVDDDCLLDVESIFKSPFYRKHHYHGRRIERTTGTPTPRDFHHSKSYNLHARKTLDKLPDPCLFAAGGAGYILSRHAAHLAVTQSETADGARLADGCFLEDNLIGHLLALCNIFPSDEEYDVSIRRRTHPHAMPVGMYGNFFMPGSGSTIKLVHLDGYEDMEVAWKRIASPELWPKKIWPTDLAPDLGRNSNQLELLCSQDRLDIVATSDVIVICMVRNELVLLPHFLKHYRGLGVRAFVIVDNLSNDGTREYLVSQADVVLYSAETEFNRAHCGVAWQQAVLANHCLGKWVVVADADEFLMYAGFETRGISAFISEVQESGANAVVTPQIDMYPKSDLKEADFAVSDPFDVACYFDRDPLVEQPLAWGRFGNFQSKGSALRHRLSPNSSPNLFTSQKVALFQYFPWVRLSEGMHCVANVRVASQIGFLAHFKYHSGFQQKVITEIQRKQHFKNAIEYEKYHAMLAEAKGVLWSDSASRKFTESHDLYCEAQSPVGGECNESGQTAPPRTPFIIWTLQRTGGSNLSDEIFERVSPNTCFHEPFNQGRVYGAIVERWKSAGNVEQLRAELREVCKSGVCFKHCVEVVPDRVNEILVEVSQEFGYVHLFLYRKDALSRLLSCHFARISGIWGPNSAKDAGAIDRAFRQVLPVKALADHERISITRLRFAWKRLRSKKAPLHAIAFEDIYEAVSRPAARETLLAMFKFLEFQIEEGDLATIDRIARQGDQGTRNLYANFSGVEALRKALERCPRFDPHMEKRLLESLEISYPNRDKRKVIFVAVDDILVSEDDESLVLKGLVLLKDQGRSNRLVFLAENHTSAVEWGITSPLFAKRYPSNPNAAKARFESVDIPLASLSSGRPGQLVLMDEAGTQSVICKIGRKSASSFNSELAIACDISLPEKRSSAPGPERDELGKHFEVLLACIYRATLRPGDWVIDGGANGGLHTIPLAHIVTLSGRVFAFEPQIDVSQRLTQRALDEGVGDTVEVVCEALGKLIEPASFFRRGPGGALSSLNRPVGELEKEITAVEQVQVVTLDSKQFERKISFIKLDLRGGEFDALQGAATLISKNSPIIVFENGKQWPAQQNNYSKEQFFLFFERLGYTLHDFFGNRFTLARWDDESTGWYFIASPAHDKVAKEILVLIKLYWDCVEGTPPLADWGVVARRVAAVVHEASLSEALEGLKLTSSKMSKTA